MKTPTELLPEIHTLPRADKLRLMDVLVTHIASDEDITLLLQRQKEVTTVIQPYCNGAAAETIVARRLQHGRTRLLAYSAAVQTTLKKR